jgi:thiol-disulfide isomerase/thioredoxin
MMVQVESGLKTFNVLVKKNQRVVVNFWGDCQPCMTQNENLKKLNKLFGFNITILCINTDEHRNLLEAFEIGRTPTLMVYYKGRRLTLQTRQGLTDRIIGVIDLKDLEQLFRNLSNLKA